MGDDRLKCTAEQLEDALRGSLGPIQRELLAMYLQSVELIDRQVLQLEKMTAQTMRGCPEAVIRLAEAPGRRVMCQCAQAAVKRKNSWFQALFRRLLPRLGYNKALWAVVRHLSRVVWKILHQRVRYQERGDAPTPEAAKRRAQRMVRQLRRLGYLVEIRPAAAVAPA